MSRFLIEDLSSIRGMTPELEKALVGQFEYYFPAPRRAAEHRAAIRHLQRGKRGRPLDIHRQALRLDVFHALVAHGIPLTASCRGRAAQALLAVFDEADRRDGTARDAGALSLAERAIDRFSRKQWAKWLAEYREDLAFIRGAKFPPNKK
jgi:hypothetical protein